MPRSWGHAKKIIEATFSFPEFALALKNLFTPSVHSWDTVNFRPNWPHPFFNTAIQNFFDQLLIYVDVYQVAKKSSYFIDLFLRYGWLKNPAIWLAWEQFGPYLRNKNFPKYEICAATQPIEVFIINKIQ